ncbi:LHFPL tetraspan subfamily member 2a protein-like [Actinia tenebrosa]|uniref:LHFPL tetraspan subfamily member 2a protein-like n=1 Tax=Actinia tenebrosa TaxID=6105 RepID=A0A6P8HNV6_ACTTE|nr:LHFPL tetraspan subfamily member 2a protein-like [Actinia tenebrosa]XP_031556724.1 LHFPL tetraspan subfamily member 2a protein-like [Actinia tenebrosa]
MAMDDHYVIVTSWNILWFLLSVSSPLATVAGILTPEWLKGSIELERQATNQTQISDGMKIPSLGIINWCINIATYVNGKRELRCMYYGDSFDDIACGEWKACIIFLVIGTAILSVVVFMAFIGFCVQSIGRKSIFTIGGLIQAIGGLFLIVGLVLYPAGWGNERVERLCAKSFQTSGAFAINECSLGWAFYAALGGTIAAFLCSAIAIQAEKSTSSDKVQDQILVGKTCICLI